MKLYSNEIVFKGHPDKLCDRIGDAILDAYLREDKYTRAGIEVTGGKGKIFVTGEVTSKGVVDIVPIIHRILEDANLNTDKYEIINNIGVQSADIAQGVDMSIEGKNGVLPEEDAIGAGDQGCIAKGSLVTTDEGLKKIENVKIGDSVLTSKGFKKVVQAKRTGFKEIIKLRTNLGTVLCLTPDHLVKTDLGWVEAEKSLGLTINVPSSTNFIYNPYSYKVLPTEKYHGGRYIAKESVFSMTEDIAYLMGFLIGDGSITSDNCFTFAFKNRDKLDIVLSVLEMAFPECNPKVYKNGIVVNSKGIRNYLYNMGLLYWGAIDKRVPDSILQNSVNIQAAFVRGFMDADGSICITRSKGRTKDSCKISMSSISYLLLNDIKLILRNLGINCLLTKNGFSKGNIKSKNMSYRINLRGSDSIYNFYEKIGFSVKYKKDRLDSFMTTYDGNRKFSFDEKVIEIEVVGDSDVYDLEVEDCHEFYANGILVHNCMFGYASNETQYYVPKAMAILQEFSRTYEGMRKKNPDLFYADGKAQITGYYDDEFRLTKIKTFTISYQNSETDRKFTDHLIKTAAEMICYKYKVEVEEFLINPTGKFLIGSFEGDAGVLGRKIVVDAYHGFAPVGGGAQSGKDPTKVDRSGAYKARQLAIRTLKKYNLKWCEIQLSYAIGKAEPLAIYIDSDKGNLEVPAEWYKECTPANIIKDLKLRQPIYEETACFGHFGSPPDAFGRVFSWEN